MAFSLFQLSLTQVPPHTQWRCLDSVDADGDAPSRRGDHTACVDPDNESLVAGTAITLWVHDIRITLEARLAAVRLVPIIGEEHPTDGQVSQATKPLCTFLHHCPGARDVSK